jgi:predicted ATPase
MLKRVEIEGFKCLHKVATDLEPFTVLIGPNDSGKSSFLQALWDASAFARGEHRQRLTDATSGGAVRILMVREKDRSLIVLGARGKPPPAPPNSYGLRNITASPFFYAGVTDATTTAGFRVSEPVSFDPVQIASFPNVELRHLDKLIQSRGAGTAAHLAHLALGDRTRYEAVQSALRTVSRDRVQEYVITDRGSGSYAMSFRMMDGAVVPAADVSHGVLLYTAFLALVHRDDAPDVILVEEPENSLHPLRLHELVALLRTLNERGVQVVVATHSPDLLNACEPREVRVFLRPGPTAGTEIHKLPPDFTRRAMRETLGEIWAARGEEGLLDLLPPVSAAVRAEPG